MTSAGQEHKPVVTIAALYGAAGSVIGPAVAERLDVPFLDRAIRVAAAERAGLTEAAVAHIDETPRRGLARVTDRLGRVSTMSGGVGGSVEDLDGEERAVRGQIEEFLGQASRSGGVAMGRGGMVILRSVAWALHVHLGGPRNDRIARRMTIDGLDQATAEERQEVEDRSRMSYVRRAYGVDGEDPALYHLMLDSTALDIDTCVDIVAAAARARTRQPRASPPI